MSSAFIVERKGRGSDLMPPWRGTVLPGYLEDLPNPQENLSFLDQTWKLNGF